MGELIRLPLNAICVSPRTSNGLVVLSVMVVMFSYCAHGANLLFFSGYGEGSHYLASTAIAEEMCKQGHSATVMVSSPFRYRIAEPHQCLLDKDFKLFKVNKSLDDMVATIREVMRHGYQGTFNQYVLQNGRKLSENVKGDCERIFLDGDLTQSLKSLKIDAVVYDSIFSCGALIAQYLGARVIALSPTMIAPHQARLHGIPTNPSHHPEGFSGLPSRMTFSERLMNCLCHFGSYWFQLYTFQNPYDELKLKFNIRPDVSTHDLLASADLWLFASDFAFDYAFPMMPNAVAVGGLCTKPAKPLPQDLEDFVQSSGPHGVIVFSLGTYVTNSIPLEVFRVVTEALKRLPQKVVMQYPGQPPDFLVELRDQIRTMSWIPQNDLLGHEKTVALVYQGGNNGLHEAVYHGIPLVILPVVADQHDIAVRAKDRGVGESLDIRTLVASELETVIRTIITNTSYTENMKRVSAIFHDRPERPVQRAAYWIEHVIKHGGDYMRTSGSYGHLNVFQTYLNDVLVFILVVACTIALSFRYFTKVSLRFLLALSKSRSNKAKQQ